MDAIKRASFASKQLPCGPAPLASFEDLPSDELESPEDSGSCSMQDVYGPQEYQEHFDSQIQSLPSSTPDTLSASTQSTPQVESDFDSHCTLTPGDSKTHSATELITGSLSSLSKEEDSLVAKQKKGSVSSLGAQESLELEYNQRKSSWADIFRSHNQNTKVLPIELADNDDLHSKTLPKRKHKSHLSKKDQMESKSKEKGKFLSIFKVGKKSKSSDFSIISPDSSTLEQTATIPDVQEDSRILKEQQNTLEEKENEKPNAIKLHPVQTQNDLDKLPTEPSAVPTTTDIQNNLKNLNIAEKEYNFLSSQGNVTCEKAINEEQCLEKEREEENESSESEPTTSELKDKSLSKESQDDFEAENLLSQDTSEIEEDPSLEQNPFQFKAPQLTGMLSRHQRLEVTTKPIERPRSTTPINVAPFEAFIHAAPAPTFDLKMEKIKLSLPGEQFVGRLKSPKRNTAKSWTDFCEEGLHSPRMHKKGDDLSEAFEDIFDPFTAEETNNSCWDRFQIENSSPWVAFGSKHDPQTDYFADSKMEEISSRNRQSSSVPVSKVPSDVEGLSKCTCECHCRGCDNVLIRDTGAGDFQQGTVPVDIFSDKCQCQCHERYFHLWSPNLSAESNGLCDIKKPELLSDMAS